MSWEMELDEQMLEDLYEWIDSVPLSRQKKRIERDFCDGFCVAEIVHHFLPGYVDMHNYTPAFNLQQKMANWGMLNSRVFNRFGLNVPLNITQNIANCKPGYVEVLLHNLRYKIEEKLAQVESHTQRSQQLQQQAQMMMQTYINGKMSVSNNKQGNMVPTARQSVLSMPNGGAHSNLGNHKGGKVPTLQRIEYEEKVQECLKKDEIIQELGAKVRRLEHLVQLKEVRIKELTARLDKYRPTAVIADMRKSMNNNTNDEDNNDNYDQYQDDNGDGGY